jgi:hypothetical protein
MSVDTPCKFLCEICNKHYKTSQSLWNHKHKYHTLENPQNSTIPPQKCGVSKSEAVMKYKCMYCKKEFSRSDSLNRHHQTCKFKDTLCEKLMKENELLKQQTEIYKQQVDILKKQMLQQLNSQCKIHPKTLKKINQQLGSNVSGSNNVVNSNNTNVVNNFNLIALGHESLDDIFTKKEKINILKNKYNCLGYIVEYTHFNDKYPQFRNILITNTQNNLAYKYDGNKKQFVAINKDELLDDVLGERMSDIETFYYQLEGDLDDKTKKIIEDVIDKMDSNNKYRDNKKKDIKIIIYNNRDKVSKDIIKNLEIIKLFFL